MESGMVEGLETGKNKLEGGGEVEECNEMQSGEVANNIPRNPTGGEFAENFNLETDIGKY
ncbi:hypothetical protein PIB30_065859 [Stylosanthes scabra]|uniref:Uncharacterized protein n=1 Tax=Stylosanthes scabra TaxID=79078 RepID=A0ABU6ZKU4_9FABA|nr:hypothetical protein [Stylosanthes scabra]